jgi:hypothetical protein
MVLGRIASMVAVALGCMLLVGCGGGGGDDDTAGASGGGDGSGASPTSSASGPPENKAQFIKQGDSICGKVPETYGKLRSKLENQSKKPPTKEEEIMKAAVPPLRTAAQELMDLGAPPGDEDLAAEIVDALEAAADGLEKNPQAPFTGPKSPFKEFIQLTQSYGFKGCPQL